MKIFIAGATGAIGRLLIPRLVEAGHEVTGTTRYAAKMAQVAAAGGQPVVVDVLDKAALFSTLAAVEPEVVMHQLTDLSGRDFAANSRLRIEGTRNLVDAALAIGVQRMIAQSIAWIYVSGADPADEDVPLDLDAPPPRGEMVAAVQSLEQAVAEVPTSVVLRYGILYGPGTWNSRDGFTTERVRQGALEATNGVTSFLHVADAAQAALQALDWPSGAYNIVDDKPAAGTEWLPLYANLVGAPPPPVNLGAPRWERGASNAKARQLGWKPGYPTWREGFASELV